MHALKIRTVVTIIGCLAVSKPYCQVNQWPAELKLAQDSVKTAPEPNSVTFISGQRQYMNTFDNVDTLKINQNDSLCEARQLVSYWLERNEGFDLRKQFIDLSGEVLKKNVFLPGVSMGVDWTPMLVLNSQESNQGALGSIDFGPLIRFNLFRIPMTVRGGASGKIENDSLSSGGFRSDAFNEFSKDHGYYGAFKIGNTIASLPHIPLFVDVEGYGRSMKTSRLLSGIGQALFYHDFPTGDSLSVLYTDSLINGSDALLGQEGIKGRLNFNTISDRIERSYEIKAGLKGKYRFHLQPALAYSFSRYSLMYPAKSGIVPERPNLGDRRNTNQSITMMLGNDPSFFINYSGCLRVDWENENKLFGNRIDMTKPADTSEIDTFNVKLNDYAGYKATMDHMISIQSNGGRGLQYAFNISRYSKTFPNYYYQGADTTRNSGDQDWIVQSHHLDITPLSGENGKVTVSGAYSTNLRYYLKKEQSVNNSIDYIYNLGILSMARISEKYNIAHSASAVVKRTEFEFPVGNAQAPSNQFQNYSRGITSDLSLNMKIMRSYFLTLEWPEHYEDDGAWYGNESIDTTIMTTDSARALFRPYYGILRKQWNHRVVFTLGDTIGKPLQWQCGASVESIVRKRFDSVLRDYIRDTKGSKYVIVPFLILDSKMNEHFSIHLRLKRYIDTVDDDYWDLTFLFTAGF